MKYRTPQVENGEMIIHNSFLKLRDASSTK